MSDAAWATIGVLGGATITSVIAPLVTARLIQRSPLARKVEESHRAVTVNHHSSAEPTVLDRLSDIETSVREGFAAIGDQLDDGARRFERTERAIGLPPWVPHRH